MHEHTNVHMTRPLHGIDSIKYAIEHTIQTAFQEIALCRCWKLEIGHKSHLYAEQQRTNACTLHAPTVSYMYICVDGREKESHNKSTHKEMI